MTQHPPHPQSKENIADEKFQMELTGYEIQQVLKAVGIATSLWAKNRRQCPASVDTDVLMAACDKIAHATDPKPNTTPASHQRIEQVLSELRDQGWMVAIHNDYLQDGKYYTFWLMTSRDGRYVKGESSMEHGGDLGALNQIKEAIALLREGDNK